MRFLLGLVVLLALTGSAVAESRVALVIGNARYGGELGQLANPVKDAKLMAKTLRAVGFEVIEVEDADQAGMKRAIQDFGEKLANAGAGSTGLFFYAGHGLQVAGTNYLIPVHAKIAREPDVEFEAVPVDLVMKQMEYAEAAVNIVILDACRNNPLSRGFRSAIRGLADPAVRPMGSFIAYSTAPGDVAEDGDGANSPYTTALAESLVKPGASINDVFQDVRGKVLAATNKKQVPWDSSSLTAPFYFVPAAAPAPVAGGVDPKAIEFAFWNAANESKSADDYQAYLDKYPGGDFASIARLRLKQGDPGADRVVHAVPEVAAGAAAPDAMAVEAAFWDAVETDKSVESYQAYLNKYPNGHFAAPARQRLAALATPAPTPKPPEIVALEAKLYAKDKARLREAPLADAKIVARLAADTELEATGRTTDEAWWRVKLKDGSIGYVAASAVSDRPTPPPTAAQPPQTPAAPSSTETATAAPTGDDWTVCDDAEQAPEGRAAACQRVLAAGFDNDTRHYNTLMNLGYAFYAQERYDDALKSFRGAADIDPKFYGAFLMIGRVNLDHERPEQARAALNEAVSLDPKQAASWFYRGAAARQLGDFEAATADIERAVSMQPDEPDYAEEQGLLHLFKGDIAAAVADADRAAALEPEGWMIASMFAYYLDRRYDDALAMADRAVRDVPGDVYWWLWKAMIERAKGDPDGAQASLNAARQSVSGWPQPVLDFMAGTIDAEGLRRAAQTGDALEQKQRRCEIEFYIGIRAAQSGDTAAARAALRRSQGARIYEYIEYMVGPAVLASLEPR